MREKIYKLAYVNNIHLDQLVIPYSDRDLHCSHITYTRLLEDSVNLCSFWLDWAGGQDDLMNLHYSQMPTYTFHHALAHLNSRVVSSEWRSYLYI